MTKTKIWLIVAAALSVRGRKEMREFMLSMVEAEDYKKGEVLCIRLLKETEKLLILT